MLLYTCTYSCFDVYAHVHVRRAMLNVCKIYNNYCSLLHMHHMQIRISCTCTHTHTHTHTHTPTDQAPLKASFQTGIVVTAKLNCASWLGMCLITMLSPCPAMLSSYSQSLQLTMLRICLLFLIFCSGLTLFIAISTHAISVLSTLTFTDGVWSFSNCPWLSKELLTSP